MRTVIAILFLIFSACPVFALQTPSAAPGDSRVRFVPYDAANVVKVVAYTGFQTFILFSEGEQITDIGGGDTEAWNIGVINAKNGIFIKPKADSADTNITVVTSARHYNFEMVHGKEKAKDSAPYFMVRFTYPALEAEKRAVKAEQVRVDTLLSSSSPVGATGPIQQGLNHNYWWDGSDSLRPVQAWDNGTFTYLKFAPGRDFPSAFVINDEDESESVVNIHVEEDTMVIHKTAKRFILRIGNKVTGIWNNSYSPTGPALPGRTISPDIERVVKGSAKSSSKATSNYDDLDLPPGFANKAGKKGAR